MRAAGLTGLRFFQGGVLLVAMIGPARIKERASGYAGPGDEAVGFTEGIG